MTSSMQRSTKQRTAIQQAMTQADRPLAPPDVLELAQATLPGLGWPVSNPPLAAGAFYCVLDLLSEIVCRRRSVAAA